MTVVVVTTTAPPMSIGGLIQRIHRSLKGSIRENYTLLANPVDDDDTVFNFTSLEGITTGSYLGIGAEIVHVLSTSDGGNSATVIRGMFDTAAVSHIAATLIEIDWRWLSADILTALVEEVRSWPEDIFAVRVTDVPVGSSSTAVNVALPEYRFPLRMRRTVSGKDRWIDVTNIYSIQTDLPTTQFVDGNAVFMPTSRQGGGTIRLEYASNFATSIMDLDTTTDDIGLSSSLIDCVVYGTLWRLMVDREMVRNQVSAQPEPRQAADVPQGSALRTGAAHKQLRDERLREEARRLRSLYPMRFS